MIEQQLEELINDRKEINNCDDFNRITKLWTKIKDNYTNCKKSLDNLNKEINNLTENNTIQSDKTDIDFNKSFLELKQLTEDIKSCKISELASYIKKIQLLKIKCLSKLNQEKCKIQEVK